MSSTRVHHSSPGVLPVDFRRPSRISRDAVVAIETRHDAFARRLATIWSTRAHSVVEVDHVSTDQLSMDDFASSLPIPTALAHIRIERLAASMFLQIDLPLALLFVERLLGGPGDADLGAVARRPTDLESTLVTQELLEPAVDSIDTALREIDGDRSRLLSFETAPQHLQLGAHSELLLLLTYRVEIRGDLPAQGLMTLAYPVGPLINQLEHILAKASADIPQDATDARLRDQLADAEVDLHVRLETSPFPARQIAGLEVGDILRLDHRATAPANLQVDGRQVGSAHLGRRGRRVAIQVADFIAPAQQVRLPSSSAPTPTPPGTSSEANIQAATLKPRTPHDT